MSTPVFLKTKGCNYLMQNIPKITARFQLIKEASTHTQKCKIYFYANFLQFQYHIISHSRQHTLSQVP